MPRRKKDPSVRARRNKAATRATLPRLVAHDTTTAQAYAELTVAQLRDEIGRRNDDGRTELLSKRGTKGQLVQLLLDDDSPVPTMPAHPTGWWHERTTQWWTDVWSSPMSLEWDDSDVHNLYLLALLYNDMWCATTAKARKDAATEFRLQRADLGLSPYSRRRLEWTIETAAEAQARGQQRRTRGSGAQPQPGAAPQADAAGGTPAVPGQVADDPRRVLEAVK